LLQEFHTNRKHFLLRETEMGGGGEGGRENKKYSS